MANHKQSSGKRHKSHDILHACMLADWRHRVLPEGEQTPFTNAAAFPQIVLTAFVKRSITRKVSLLVSAT